MRAKFDLMQYMKDNREQVINKYNELTNEKFFSQITLKSFMLDVLKVMQNNDPRSVKRADTLLPRAISMIYVENSKLYSRDIVTERLEKKYAGTAFMAMV